MAQITYDFGLLTDDAGALLTSSATVTIASVTNKSGATTSSPGATVNTGALPFVSVDYDAETKGDAIITLAVSQTGRTITEANASPARFCFKDAQRILGGLPAGGKLLLDHSDLVPMGGTPGSVGDCFIAARTQGFGKWVLVGTTLTLYGYDGTTVVRTFTLDSATTPTSRT